MTFTTGTKLGPYEIVQAIGAGGMGQVYKARDTRLNRFVAIKVLPDHLSENAELKARFEREAQTLASLSHPHICPVFDVGHQDGTDYVVTSLSEAPTRADVTARGTIFGTLQYMTPEQLEGIEADGRSDIFAFGAVVDEMLTGRKAFEGRSKWSLIAFYVIAAGFVIFVGAINTRDPKLAGGSPSAPHKFWNLA
jgi:serine/threonine protein kinase